MRTKNIFRLLLVVIVLLLVPFGAMFVTDEVNWDETDFIVAFVLLFGAGLAYQWFTRSVSTSKHKIVIGICVLAVLLVVWAELAVGLFGTPWAGN